MTRIVLLEGDLTEQAVDAIVNAANSALVLGSGVAGAIARRGGPSIQRECDAHGPIEVGASAITGAGELPARFVIHAAGMPPGGRATEASVRSAVRSALELAARKGCRSVALPAIGAGVGGLSMQRCAEISIEEARAFADRAEAAKRAERTDPGGQDRSSGGSTPAEEEPALEEIRFVLFGEPAFRLFEMVHDAAKVEAQMRRLRER
jgi:O-acetyl-ADP-ribose deacetylase (regulator of RNase III)